MKLKSKLLCFLTILIVVFFVSYWSYALFEKSAALLGYVKPIAEEDLCGEYKGVLQGHEYPNGPYGEHKLLLRPDHTYIYVFDSFKEEQIVFYGSWSLYKNYEIYLSNYDRRVSPFDQLNRFDNANKEKIFNKNVAVYRTGWFKIEIDIDEELQLKKVAEWEEAEKDINEIKDPNEKES